MNRQPLTPTYSLNNHVVRNYFAEYKTLLYNESEVDNRFIALYDEGIYLGKKSIIALLYATSSFLHSTTLWLEFKQTRDHIFSDIDSKKILDDMGIALREAIKKREDLSYKNDFVKKSKLVFVLTDAINYCMVCIVYRLRDLSRIQDKVYTIYETQENVLKQVMPSSLQQSAIRPQKIN